MRSLLRVWFLVTFRCPGFAHILCSCSEKFMARSRNLSKTIVFSSALASIGFDIDIDSVIQAGMKPVLVAVIGWLGVLLFFLFMAPFFIV